MDTQETHMDYVAEQLVGHQSGNGVGSQRTRAPLRPLTPGASSPDGLLSGGLLPEAASESSTGAATVPTTLTLQPTPANPYGFDARTFDTGEPILMGEAAGRVARSSLGLDDVDGREGQVTLKVEPLVVTPSYIRGLVGPSVSHLGYEGFSRKYAIEATPSVRDTILFIAEYADRQTKP